MPTSMWDSVDYSIYQQITGTISYHVTTLLLSQGPGPGHWGQDTSQSGTGTGTWLRTRHSLRTILPVYYRHYAQKVAHDAQCFLETIPKIMPA